MHSLYQHIYHSGRSTDVFAFLFLPLSFLFLSFSVHTGSGFLTIYFLFPLLFLSFFSSLLSCIYQNLQYFDFCFSLLLSCFFLSLMPLCVRDLNHSQFLTLFSIFFSYFTLITFFQSPLTVRVFCLLSKSPYLSLPIFLFLSLRVSLSISDTFTTFLFPSRNYFFFFILPSLLVSPLFFLSF